MIIKERRKSVLVEKAINTLNLKKPLREQLDVIYLISSANIGKRMSGAIRLDELTCHKDSFFFSTLVCSSGYGYKSVQEHSKSSSTSTSNERLRTGLGYLGWSLYKLGVTCGW